MLQRQVAIKLLREADNEDLRARFTREVRAAANLRHRNIVTIFDVGDHNGQPFMAMEYIHGQTVASIIATEPPPSTIRRLQFIEDLCEGLAYAHKRGVVHRDIKPANLMVDAEGTLKILDFGIARAAAESGMTQAGLMIGTLNYMSPEQVAGSALDGRSDMFAVGAVFYELLARRQAFPGAIDGGVLNRILNGDPEPLEVLCPHLDAAIVGIVSRSLRKNPADRFDDLLQMRTAVVAARRGLEDAVAADVAEAETVSAPGRTDTPAATARPLRRGPDREELARRRALQIEEHVGAAREALSAGRHDEAIGRCEEALLLDPNHTIALEIGDRARLARDEQAARTHLEHAREFLRGGELTSASQQVRDALDLFPDLPDAIEVGRVIAEARMQREREQQRRQAFEGLLVRGAAALDEGDPASASALADEALALFPADAEAKSFKERVQQAVAVRQRQERDEAARAAAADARRLFAAGSHADALALLEEFWPAHPIVSQLWTELSAEAARLAREAEAAAAPADPGVTPPPAAGADATLFIPRDDDTLQVPLPVPPIAAAPIATPIPAAMPVPAIPPAAATVPAAATPAAPVAPPATRQPAATPKTRSGEPKHAAATAGARRSPVVTYGAAAAVVVLLAGGAYVVLQDRAPAGSNVPEAVDGGAPAPSAETAPAASGASIPSGRPEGAATGAAPADAGDRGSTPEVIAPAPAAPAAATTAAPGAAAATTTADDREARVDQARQAVRRALRAADYRAALAAADSGLALAPRDADLVRAVTQIETQARSAANTARTAASARAASPSFAQAGTLVTQAQRLSRNGNRRGAARAYWQAEDLFKAARNEAAAVTPPAAPSRRAAVAENEPAPPIAPPVAAPRPAAPESAPVAAPPAAARTEVPPAPRPQAPDEEAQIRGTLAAYAQGYRNLDVDAILRVFPRAPAPALRNAFQEAREYDVQIDVTQLRVTGDRAVVNSRVRQSFRPRAGRAQETTVSAEFELQKSGGTWLIVNRR